jgi:hypothetical protein
MRAEYEFDYRRGKPNRFAAGMAGDVVVVVVLEPERSEASSGPGPHAPEPHAPARHASDQVPRLCPAS